MRPLFFSAVFFLGCVSAAPGQGIVSGKIAETMNSGGYTYVRVARGKDSIWVATAPRKVKVGDEISFPASVVMKDFHSKSLKRTFKEIIFSDGPGKTGFMCPQEEDASAHGPEAHSPAKPAQMPSLKSPPLNLKMIKSARAQGPDAFTVAEVFARRKELSGKTVSVRGVVVKVSLEIMGRNWVHLQDGSGDAKAGTNDLLATTAETVRAGETLTARGTVAKDKDFGSGYSYVVMLEKAVFKR